MHADFELNTDGSTAPSRTWGGKREGAGRKPAGYEKPQEAKDFDAARARNEAAKADLNELEFKRRSGEYVSREAVKTASATMLATLAQTLRSIRDTLERQGVPLEICEKVDATINDTLNSAAEELAMMSNNPL